MRTSTQIKNYLQLLAVTLVALVSFEHSEAKTLALSSISASPSAATSGQTVTATIRMTDKCPSAGCAITLKSSIAAAPIPASLTIPKDRTSGSVTFQAGAVSALTNMTLSATWGARTVQTSMSISPSLPTASLKSISFAPASGYEGDNSSINLSLDNACQLASCVVSLVSSHPLLVSVPSSVSIAKGQTANLMQFYAGKPSVSPTLVNVTATYSGKSVSASYSVSARSPSPTEPEPGPTGPSYSVSAYGEANLSVSTVRPDSYGYDQALRDLNGEVPVLKNIMVAYNACQAAYPGLGQLEPVGAVVQLPVTSDGYSKWYRVRQDFVCKAGPYSGWINSFTADMYRTSAYGYVRIGDFSPAQVCLTQAAPAGGAVIALTSSSTIASIPSSITIPAGALCGGFNITAKGGGSSVTIRAKLNGYSREVRFELFY